MHNNVLTLAAFPMEVVAAAKVAGLGRAAATPIGFECCRSRAGREAHSPRDEVHHDCQIATVAPG